MQILCHAQDSWHRKRTQILDFADLDKEKTYPICHKKLEISQYLQDSWWDLDRSKRWWYCWKLCLHRWKSRWGQHYCRFSETVEHILWNSEKVFFLLKLFFLCFFSSELHQLVVSCTSRKLCSWRKLCGIGIWLVGGLWLLILSVIVCLWGRWVRSTAVLTFELSCYLFAKKLNVLWECLDILINLAKMPQKHLSSGFRIWNNFAFFFRSTDVKHVNRSVWDIFHSSGLFVFKVWGLNVAKNLSVDVSCRLCFTSEGNLSF